MYCLIFTVPAYAQSSEPQPETTPAPAETEAEPETQNPFTPDGTGTVVDNATDEDGKEFYTITTADESVFYLVIDKQKTSENVYFLNTVTTDDLLPGTAGLCGLRKGVFARGASSLLLRRLQGRRKPSEKPGTHEENAGEKAGRLLRFAASKGLTFRAFLRVFPGWEYLITFLLGLPSYFVTSSTSGHVSLRHRKEVSLGDSTRICDFESCHL